MPRLVCSSMSVVQEFYVLVRKCSNKHQTLVCQATTIDLLTYCVCHCLTGAYSAHSICLCSQIRQTHSGIQSRRKAEDRVIMIGLSDLLPRRACITPHVSFANEKHVAKPDCKWQNNITIIGKKNGHCGQ